MKLLVLTALAAVTFAQPTCNYVNAGFPVPMGLCKNMYNGTAMSERYICSDATSTANLWIETFDGYDCAGSAMSTMDGGLTADCSLGACADSNLAQIVNFTMCSLTETWAYDAVITGACSYFFLLGADMMFSCDGNGVYIDFYNSTTGMCDGSYQFSLPIADNTQDCAAQGFSGVGVSFKCGDMAWIPDLVPGTPIGGITGPTMSTMTGSTEYMSTMSTMPMMSTMSTMWTSSMMSTLSTMPWMSTMSTADMDTTTDMDTTADMDTTVADSAASLSIKVIALFGLIAALF